MCSTGFEWISCKIGGKIFNLNDISRQWVLLVSFLHHLKFLQNEILIIKNDGNDFTCRSQWMLQMFDETIFISCKIDKKSLIPTNIRKSQIFFCSFKIDQLIWMSLIFFVKIIDFSHFKIKIQTLLNKMVEKVVLTIVWKKVFWDCIWSPLLNVNH